MYAEGDLKYRKVLYKSVIKNVQAICHPKLKRNYILHTEKRPILRPLSVWQREIAKSHFTHCNKEKNKYIHNIDNNMDLRIMVLFGAMYLFYVINVKVWRKGDFHDYIAVMRL